MFLSLTHWQEGRSCFFIFKTKLKKTWLCCVLFFEYKRTALFFDELEDKAPQRNHSHFGAHRFSLACHDGRAQITPQYIKKNIVDSYPMLCISLRNRQVKPIYISMLQERAANCEEANENRLHVCKGKWPGVDSDG